LEKKDYDKAITDFDEAIRLDPEAAASYYNRGVALLGRENLDKENLDKAVRDFDKANRLDPAYAFPATAYRAAYRLWAIQRRLRELQGGGDRLAD